jgi:acyl carrier protein
MPSEITQMTKTNHALDKDAVASKIKSIIERIWSRENRRGKSNIKINDKLVADLGFESVEVLELVVKIEKEMGIEIPDEFLRAEYFETSAAVIETVEKSIRQSGLKNSD